MSPVVRFLRNKDFRYTWRTVDGVLEIGVSDYLEDAPADVLRDFIRFVEACAAGSWEGPPPSVSGYIGSPGFIASKRPVFVSRSRNLACTDTGEYRNIPDSLSRLADAGLIGPYDTGDSYFSWTRRDNRRRMGFCSRMFRVVGISSRLDSPDVPEWVLDYVVYHEVLHLRQGYGCPVSHDGTFRQWEHSYSLWREAEAFLSSL